MHGQTQRIKLWDLPTRLFHWLLAGLITAAVVTGKIGGNAIVWHGRIGLCIVGLLAFRIVWGLAGSTYARFLTFLPTPSSVTAYLRGQWRGLGHNPLGAFSVFGMLALVGFQVGTGLFANDDIAFRGPLYSLAGEALSQWLTRVHHIAVNALIALIVLHLGAIAYYAHVKRDNLVRPMIDGWKEVSPHHEIQAVRGGGLVALILALTVATGAVYGASGIWIEQEAPSTPVATPPAAW